MVHRIVGRGHVNDKPKNFGAPLHGAETRSVVTSPGIEVTYLVTDFLNRYPDAMPNSVPADHCVGLAKLYSKIETLVSGTLHKILPPLYKLCKMPNLAKNKSRNQT